MNNCLVCNHSLKGRSDKKFCCNHCRSQYHNQKRHLLSAKVSRVNKVLLNNRKIILEYLEQNRQEVSRWELEQNGFDFRFFTNQFISELSNCYRFCYDVAYRVEKNDLIQLMMSNEFNKKFGLTT